MDDFPENVSVGCIYMVEPKESGKIIGEINRIPPILHFKKNKWMENYIKICNKTVA